MEFKRLLEIVGSEPLFETGLLLAGNVDPNHVRRQLSRWTTAGKLIQLRRGLYTLAPPYRKVAPHPFLIANRMMRGSYVSLQAALAYYGMIPEYVPLVTSVTTDRPATFETALGRYTFRHIRQSLLYGYQLLDVGNGQQVYIATPEKAILDQVYLEPDGDDLNYLRGLRLQSLDLLDLNRLQELAVDAKSPKLRRAVDAVSQLAEEEAEAEYETLPTSTP